MTTIVTRAGKGSPLTNAEVDANFTNLNSAKLEASNNLSDLANAATARTNLGVAIGTNVQAWDADLAAIAALAGTSGFLKKTAANTWSLDTNTYITGNQTITFTGDATGSGTTSVALTLANSGVTAGTYTKVTVDGKGRVTAGSSLASADLPTYTGTLTSSQVTTALGFTPFSNAGGNITGNVSIGTTLQTWSVGKALQVGATTAIADDAGGGAYLIANAYYNGGWKYIANGVATMFAEASGGFAWYSAVSGTAGATVTFSQPMTLSAAGALNTLGAITQNGNQVLHAGNYTSYVDVTASNTVTLTNKTVVPRVVPVVDGTSITINADTTDLATQANTQAAGTLTINAPTGTPVNGQRLMLRLQTTNVQTLSFNAAFAGSTDVALPTASSGSSKYDYLGFIYNSAAAKWQFVAKSFGY